VRPIPVTRLDATRAIFIDLAGLLGSSPPHDSAWLADLVAESTLERRRDPLHKNPNLGVTRDRALNRNPAAIGHQFMPEDIRTVAGGEEQSDLGNSSG
jgi:hypothetical protein